MEARMDVHVRPTLTAYQLSPLVSRTSSARTRHLRHMYTAAAYLVPLVGACAAFVRAGREGIGAVEIVSLTSMYLVTLLGITVGYHRGLSHRAFRAQPALEAILLALGAMAGHGPVLRWVADHRRHHQFAERAQDPHSPNDGFWHAHVGWLFTSSISNTLYYCRDVIRNPRARFIGWTYPFWFVAGILLPGLGAYVVTRDSAALVSGALWGGFVRLALCAQATFSVNSLCHMWGRRPFATNDRSTNLAWLAVPTLGEAWHNNHHAEPSHAHFGMHPWQVDIGGLFIAAMARIGWITHVHGAQCESRKPHEDE